MERQKSQKREETEALIAEAFSLELPVVDSRQYTLQ
jgi:hypothetical protein